MITYGWLKMLILLLSAFAGGYVTRYAQNIEKEDFDNED